MGNIPTMTKNLLVVNVLAFIATFVLERSGIDLTRLLGLHFFLASEFHIYQFITYMFLHGGFTHILFNMFALWMFGSVIERVWGPKKFLFYYIVCGVGAGFIQELVQYVNYSVEGLAAYQYVSVSGVQMTTDAYINMWTTIGASGAVYGILLAFGMIFPNERLFIIPIPFPIKAKWFVCLYAAIEILEGMSASDGVAHFAHLGGMFFGLMLILFWRNAARYKIVDFGKNFWRRPDSQPSMHVNYNDNYTKDYEYNSHKKARNDEIDRILDKVRKGGYQSLTESEKQTLFDASGR